MVDLASWIHTLGCDHTDELIYAFFDSEVKIMDEVRFYLRCQKCTRITDMVRRSWMWEVDSALIQYLNIDTNDYYPRINNRSLLEIYLCCSEIPTELIQIIARLIWRERLSYTSKLYFQVYQVYGLSRLSWMEHIISNKDWLQSEHVNTITLKTILDNSSIELMPPMVRVRGVTKNSGDWSTL